MIVVHVDSFERKLYQVSLDLVQRVTLFLVGIKTAAAAHEDIQPFATTFADDGCEAEFLIKAWVGVNRRCPFVSDRGQPN